eukprot:12013817-Karenia_brevis.AAC.1
MGMGSAVVGARVGRIACLLQCLPTARKHLRKIFPYATEEQILHAVPLDGAEAELESLRAEGIELAVSGTVACGNEPRINLCESFKP